MPFDWLKRFQQSQEKPENYAEKTLAAYRLGMKAGGSIAGVSILAGAEACPEAQALPEGAVYHPDQAPRLPLTGCGRGRGCTCVYRPVMAYPPADTMADTPGDPSELPAERNRS